MHIIYQYRIVLVILLAYLVTNIVIFSWGIHAIDVESLRNEVIILNACIWACVVAEMFCIRTFIARERALIAHERGQQYNERDTAIPLMIIFMVGSVGLVVSCWCLADISRHNWSLLGEPIFIFTFLPFYGICLLAGVSILSLCVYHTVKCCYQVVQGLPCCCQSLATECYDCWCQSVTTTPLAAIVVTQPNATAVAKITVQPSAPPSAKITVQPSAPPSAETMVNKQNEHQINKTTSSNPHGDFGDMKIFKSDTCVVCLTSFVKDGDAKLLMTCGHVCCHVKCAVQVCPLCRVGKPLQAYSAVYN